MLQQASNLQTAQLTILIACAVEVLLRIVSLTRLQRKPLTYQLCVCWVACLLGFFSSVIDQLDTGPVSTSIAWRIFVVPLYPLMFASFQLVLANRWQVVDLARRVTPRRVWTLVAVSALVSLATEGERCAGVLILAGVVQGSMDAAPGIVSASAVWFCAVNIAMYAGIMYSVKSVLPGIAMTSAAGTAGRTGAKRHLLKIKAVMLVSVAIDLWIFALAVSGDFRGGYQMHSFSYMLLLRLELEIWNDFVRLVKGDSAVGSPRTTTPAAPQQQQQQKQAPGGGSSVQKSASGLPAGHRAT
ncbi:hypothetical protein RI367_002623 [Sorochytrium milnesiophthora]